MSALSLRCLVLNGDFRPISVYPLSIIPAQDAIVTVLRDRAVVVEEWDEVFRSPSRSMPVPRTIALRQYVHVDAEAKFCRRSILLRDRFKCQYCGQRFQSHELTFDHVIPRSKGGQTVWTNILSACIECNGKKRDNHANYSGRKGAGDLRPLKAPRQPTSAELMRAGMEFLDPAIKSDWGSWLYWSAELQS